MNKTHGALVALFIGLVCAAPTWAQWPTMDWIVQEKRDAETERQAGIIDDFLFDTAPVGERLRIAQKHERMLHMASRWYASMGFPPPLQINQDGDLSVKKGDHYLAYLKQNPEDSTSGHDSDGEMHLSSNPFFLNPKTKADHLLESSAVHELFHGIQSSDPTSSYFKYSSTQPTPPGPPECRKTSITGSDWIDEGAASYVQIRWMEYIHGYQYGHPFKGSPRGNWLRYFDQPLDWPSLPPNLRESAIDQSLIKRNRVEGQSWLCSYGTWYFWYAMGELLGSKQASDPRRLTYLNHIFNQPGPWQKTGLAQVDAGLREAAQAYDVIRPYQGGLFNLYPLFVARYLDNDRFYEHLENVTLESLDYYEAGTKPSNGALQPLATRAWRFRIAVPKETAGSAPTIIRIVLETDTDREPLHLIVNRQVISPPASPTALYSHTIRSSTEPRNEDGDIELLVRVANVARDAAGTQPADFKLRVEVEGFYGDAPDSSWIDQVAGELPPGFDVQGPGPMWNCTGGADARASFTLMTPDGIATEIGRMFPQIQKNLGSDFDRAEVAAAESEDALASTSDDKEFTGDVGIAGALSLAGVQGLRAYVESKMAVALADRAGVAIDDAAGEFRARNETTLSAQFYGQHGTKDCMVGLRATLPGRSGGAQTVTGDDFSVSVRPQAAASIDHLEALATSNSSDWNICDEAPCPEPRLVLEHAEHNHLAGSFQFQLVRKDKRGIPLAYQNVSGHFHTTSTHTDQDIGLLDFMNRITDSVTGDIPWTNPLLPGGSTFVLPQD